MSLRISRFRYKIKTSEKRNSFVLQQLRIKFLIFAIRPCRGRHAICLSRPVPLSDSSQTSSEPGSLKNHVLPVLEGTRRGRRQEKTAKPSTNFSVLSPLPVLLLEQTIPQPFSPQRAFAPHPAVGPSPPRHEFPRTQFVIVGKRTGRRRRRRG